MSQIKGLLEKLPALQWHRIVVLVVLLVLAGALFLPASPRSRGAEQVVYEFHTYCIKGRIEISRRTFAEIRMSRSTVVCVLQSAGTLRAALDGARSIGGVGSPCQCRSQFDDEKEQKKVHRGVL